MEEGRSHGPQSVRIVERRKGVMDARAVSPVIAVVLMVAITVVLASVVYVMVTSLIVPTHKGGASTGIDVGTTADGTNWTLDFVTVHSGLSTNYTYILVKNLSGNLFVSKTPLANFTGFEDIKPFGVINPGDRVLLSKSLYQARMVVEIVDDANILWFGELA